MSLAISTFVNDQIEHHEAMTEYHEGFQEHYLKAKAKFKKTGRWPHWVKARFNLKKAQMAKDLTGP